MKKLPHMNRPCAKCPFRKDCTKGWLRGERAKEIADSSEFVCHKTTQSNDIDRRQCAGHMILSADHSNYVYMAETLGVDLNLTGEELVFDSIEDMIAHHDNY